MFLTAYYYKYWYVSEYLKFYFFYINFSVGVFLFSFLCVLGSSTFAAGIFLKGTSYMLPIMLLGRLLFGSGNGSLTSKKNPSRVRFITEIIDFNKAQILVEKIS